MNNAQKITIGITLLIMFAISFFLDWYGLEELIREGLLPIIFLGGAFFTFFSLRRRRKNKKED